MCHIGTSEEKQKSLVKIILDNYKYIATGDHHSMMINNKNKMYTWGFGGTYAFRNQNENNELLPFELECEEFGKIIEIEKGSQYSAILSSFYN
ncbi:2971_t:CDS:2 [Cetraspora pellucida]|uniref:2971_t:CDS:1 n=1 Tax=Cetraspora pellucida TaxID=1433469 RepID=A0A9N9G2U2_9GLOM|nr:2971_t:CDS:2 [Cetraspora pellucida]